MEVSLYAIKLYRYYILIVFLIRLELQHKRNTTINKFTLPKIKHPVINLKYKIYFYPWLYLKLINENIFYISCYFFISISNYFVLEIHKTFLEKILGFSYFLSEKILSKKI